jgi:hypothetical protein
MPETENADSDVANVTAAVLVEDPTLHLDDVEYDVEKAIPKTGRKRSTNKKQKKSSSEKEKKPSSSTITKKKMKKKKKKSTILPPLIPDGDDHDAYAKGPKPDDVTVVEVQVPQNGETRIVELFKQSKDDKLGVVYSFNDWKVLRVKTGGKADVAGLRNGQKILFVNGEIPTSKCLTNAEGKIQLIVTNETASSPQTASSVAEDDRMKRLGMVAIILIVVGIVVSLFSSILFGAIVIVCGVVVASIGCSV